MTHVHRRSNPCRLDRTRQLAVSGRSRDTRSQAVKSLPARLHSAGGRVREEPRHTYTGGQIPAGQTALGRSPCQRRSRDTRSQAVKSLPARPHSAGRRVREEPRHAFTSGQIPSGQTALGRSPCQGGAATRVHRRSNPCRPDRTRQVAMSGRSRDTRTQAVIPAGQTTLGRSPYQGGAATHVHRRSSLPARPHSAGHRAREEPRHRYTCGQPCWPDHTH